MFYLYLELGFEHITNIVAYDHILFLATLVAIYLFKDWKKVLILVTAFTIGHSVSLALATFNVFHVNVDLIEFLIPVTIFISAISNFFNKAKLEKKQKIKYFIAMFFGLIHGLGFSNYLRSLLGDEGNIVSSLFAFNIGIEIGQILLVIAYLSIANLIVKFLKIPLKYISYFVTIITIIVSIFLMIERFPFAG